MSSPCSRCGQTELCKPCRRNDDKLLRHTVRVLERDARKGCKGKVKK